MRHGRQSSFLVRQFAEQTKRSLRAAQWQRKHATPEWQAFVTARAEKTAGDPVEVPFVIDNRISPDVPRGIGAEIMRMESECAALSVRLEQAIAKNDLAGELQLHRTLDFKRETLRKLRCDAPGIDRELGHVIPVEYVTRYAARISQLLQSLPHRVSTLIPSDLAHDIKLRLGAEVDMVLKEASEVPIDDETH